MINVFPITSGAFGPELLFTSDQLRAGAGQLQITQFTYDGLAAWQCRPAGHCIEQIRKSTEQVAE